MWPRRMVQQNHAKQALLRRLLEQRRDRRAKFFHRKPPEVLDVCQVPMAGRVTR